MTTKYMDKLIKGLPLTINKYEGLTIVYDTQYKDNWRWVVGYTEAPSWFGCYPVGEGKTIEEAIDDLKAKVDLLTPKK